jgi:parallel beta-helix repeat protein
VLEDIKTSLTTCCAEITVDFEGVFTTLEDIKSSLTQCCNDVVGIFTILNDTQFFVSDDVQAVMTILQDIRQTLTSCCADIIVDFDGVFTTLRDINSSLTQCCGDLVGIFTTNPNVIARGEFTNLFTVLTDINASLTNCCADIIVDFDGTFSTLIDIRSTLTDCCADLMGIFTATTNITAIGEFTDVFTLLADINRTLTTCCERIEADLSGIFSTIAAFHLDCTTSVTVQIFTDLSGIFTVLEDIRATLTECCSCNLIPVGVDGQPFTISSPGAYCLANDITAAAGSAITISADDIYLDLNNHELIGTGATVGINVGSARTNIIIKNGLIRDIVGTGIIFGAILPNPTDRNVTLENITVTSSNIGFRLINVIDANIKACRSFGNSFGFQLQQSTNLIIQKCTVNQTFNTGIQISLGCSNIQISDVELQQNGLGLSIHSSDDATIIRALATEGQTAFVCDGCNRIKFKNCAATSNSSFTSGGNGFSFLQSTDVICQECISANNTALIASTASARGFIATLCTKAIFDNCLSLDHVATATGIGFALVTCIDSCIINCMAKRNTGNSSAGIGIFVSNCTDCQIQDNTVIENTGALFSQGITIINTGGAGSLTTATLDNSAQAHGSNNYVVNPGTIPSVQYTLDPFFISGSPTLIDNLDIV